MIQPAKKILERLGLYAYVKYSPFFAVYERLFKPQVEKERNREIAFYRSFLPHCPLIFDIGANDGHKTVAFLHLAEKIVSCEPDPANFRKLKMQFRNKKDRVFLENAALGAKEGISQMFLHHEGSAFNTLNEKFKNVTENDDLQKWNEKIHYTETRSVKTVTLNSLIRKYGTPSFIKIDVEGYELEVLKGLDQPVPFISIECLLPEFWEELQQSLGLLLQLDPKARFNIAVHEQLVLPQFLAHQELIAFLKNFKQPHFELVIRMKA